MADPLSLSVSVLAVVTAAIQSTKSLCATVKRYQDRDKTLGRLRGELEDLIGVLSQLEQAVDSEASIFALLRSPVKRCSQICREFEEAMNKFSGKSRTGLRDWSKMEFMKDDINGFLHTLNGYKSTIAIGLGTITMHHSMLSHEVLERYSEMIKDTTYNLQIHLQRVDEKLASIAADSTDNPGTNVDLQDEREVTRQCLRICQDAMSYLENLQDRQPSSPQVAAPRNAGTVRNLFDAEVMTRQTLNESRDRIVATMGRLQGRLDSLISSEGSEHESQRSRLQEDIYISKQCLEVCKAASDRVSYQKIHIIGEVRADDDTDQVVITTLADLFDVGKVLAKSRSAQLVGSMSDESLQKVSADRYNSRFGAITGDPGRGPVGIGVPASGLESRDDTTQPPVSTKKDGKQGIAETKRNRPSSNEVRKRAAEGEGHT